MAFTISVMCSCCCIFWLLKFSNSGTKSNQMVVLYDLSWKRAYLSENESEYYGNGHAKKVVFNSLMLVDVAMRLVVSDLYLPNRQVKVRVTTEETLLSCNSFQSVFT